MGEDFGESAVILVEGGRVTQPMTGRLPEFLGDAWEGLDGHSIEAGGAGGALDDPPTVAEELEVPADG